MNGSLFDARYEERKAEADSADEADSAIQTLRARLTAHIKRGRRS